MGGVLEPQELGYQVYFLNFFVPTSGATVEQKNGVLEYHKKWYFPNYFQNSALLLNISKINANGPFWPISSPKRPFHRCGPTYQSHIGPMNLYAHENFYF